MANPAYKHFFKNTSYVIFGNIGSRVISVLMLPLYTRWLSVEQYGVIDLLSVYSNLFIIIIGACMADAIFVIPANKGNDVKKELFTSGFFYLIIASVFFASFFPLIKLLPTSILPKSINENLLYFSLLLFGGLFQGYTQGFCKAIDKMKAYSITGFVYTLAATCLSIILVPKYKIGGYVVSFSLSYLICVCYNLFFNSLYKYLCIDCINYKRIKELLTYSIPLIPNGLMWWLIAALNKPLLETYTGFFGVGLMAIAQKIPNFLNSLNALFATSWQVSVLQEFGTPDYRLFYNRMFNAFVVVLFSSGVFLALFSPFFLQLIADEKFYEAHKYVPLLLASVTLGSLAPLVAANFAATKKSKYYFYSTIYGATLSLLLNNILIPLYEIWGAVVSILCSQLVVLTVRIYYANNIVKHDRLHYLLALLLSYIAVNIIFSMDIAYYIKVVVSLVYISLICFLNKKDIENLFVKIRKKI